MNSAENDRILQSMRWERSEKERKNAEEIDRKNSVVENHMDKIANAMKEECIKNVGEYNSHNPIFSQHFTCVLARKDVSFFKGRLVSETIPGPTFESVYTEKNGEYLTIADIPVEKKVGCFEARIPQSGNHFRWYQNPNCANFRSDHWISHKFEKWLVRDTKKPIDRASYEPTEVILRSDGHVERWQMSNSS